MMKIQMKGISLMIILLMLALTVQAAVLRGTITDKATKEPLIGAAVQLSGTNIGTITDVDGNFEHTIYCNLNNLCTIRHIRYNKLVRSIS